MPVNELDQLEAYRSMIPDVFELHYDVHREVSEEMGRLIEEHANGHRNSNSPYGHVCPSSCLASSILLWQARMVKERMDVETGVNPHLPEAPSDGKHIFQGSYRCKRCGVYNRPDVPSTLEVLNAPCEGGWAQSGKMRAAAEDRWKVERGDR